MRNKNFQRAFTNLHSKILWKFEKDLNPGDFILLFPNPDRNLTLQPTPAPDTAGPGPAQGAAKKGVIMGNFVSREKAERDFDALIAPEFDFNLHRKFVRLLREVFLEVFDELTDYVETQEKKSIFSYLGFGKSRQRIEVEAAGIDTEPLATGDGKQQREEILAEMGGDDEGEGTSNKAPTAGGSTGTGPSVGTQRRGGPKVLPKLKIIAGGQFFEEVMEAQTQQLDDDELDPQKHGISSWRRTDNPVKDYMTLLRLTMYTLLSYHGFVIREFISHDSDLIIAVCYGHLPNIRRLAELIGLNKQVSLSILDLMSLEPVDQKFRPLRVNGVLWNERKWNEFYTSDLGAVENPTEPEGENNRPKRTSKQRKVSVSDNMDAGTMSSSTRKHGSDFSKVTVQVRKRVKQESKEQPNFPSNLETEENPLHEHPQVKPEQSAADWVTEEIPVPQLRKEIMRLLLKIDYKKIVRRSFGLWDKSDFMSK